MKLVAAAFAIGCGAAPPHTSRASSCPPGENLAPFRETTVNEASGRSVGTADIYPREGRMSALLAVWSDGSNGIDSIVSEGSIVPIGSDRYCVMSIEEGHTTRGSVTLRKLAP